VAVQREPQAGSGQSAKAAVGPAGRLPSMLGRARRLRNSPLSTASRSNGARTVLAGPALRAGHPVRPARPGAANAPRPLPARGSALRTRSAHAALHASEGTHARMHECTSACSTERVIGPPRHWPSATGPP